MSLEQRVATSIAKHCKSSNHDKVKLLQAVLELVEPTLSWIVDTCQTQSAERNIESFKTLIQHMTRFHSRTIRQTFAEYLLNNSNLIDRVQNAIFINDEGHTAYFHYVLYLYPDLAFEMLRQSPSCLRVDQCNVLAFCKGEYVTKFIEAICATRNRELCNAAYQALIESYFLTHAHEETFQELQMLISTTSEDGMEGLDLNYHNVSLLEPIISTAHSYDARKNGRELLRDVDMMHHINWFYVCNLNDKISRSSGTISCLVSLVSDYLCIKYREENNIRCVRKS